MFHAAGFLRPVVSFGPIADVAREKLSREEPDLFELASMCGCAYVPGGLKDGGNNPLNLVFQRVNQETQEQISGVQESFVFTPSNRS